jgi:deazaflavin-dependent oxidoreductase (nitroreductase family)
MTTKRTTFVRQWKAHKTVWKLSRGHFGRRVVGMPVLELVSIGHRSGEERSVLLTFIDKPDGPVVFGTNAGLDIDPAWTRNVRGNPNVRVRINGVWASKTAVEIEDDSVRDRLWADVVAANKDYQDYLSTLTRRVPIIQLTTPKEQL